MTESWQSANERSVVFENRELRTGLRETFRRNAFYHQLRTEN